MMDETCLFAFLQLILREMQFIWPTCSRNGFHLSRFEVFRSLRLSVLEGAKPMAYVRIAPPTARRRKAWKADTRARRCSLKGRERAIVSQTNAGTVSKALDDVP